MKAEELMIGDWVLKDMNYLEDDPMYTRLDYQPYQIMTGDEIDVAIETNCIGDADVYQPIPLTAEILEANGFIKDEDSENGSKYHLLVPTGHERNSYTIQVTLYKEPICGVKTLVKCWGWVPPYNGGLNDIHLCSANHVHELQHALRLCGIEKEIIM